MDNHFLVIYERLKFCQDFFDLSAPQLYICCYFKVQSQLGVATVAEVTCVCLDQPHQHLSMVLRVCGAHMVHIVLQAHPCPSPASQGRSTTRQDSNTITSAHPVRLVCFVKVITWQYLQDLAPNDTFVREVQRLPTRPVERVVCAPRGIIVRFKLPPLYPVRWVKFSFRKKGFKFGLAFAGLKNFLRVNLINS